MGAVYEAIDERLSITVALKQTIVVGEHFDKAFEREAKLLAMLRHPALPVVSDHFIDETGQFLVMQFIPGTDLGALLAKQGGAFPVAQVLDWASQLLKALEYLHGRQPPILHRDIKPQNIKLTTEGELVLLDFGLAKGTTSAQTQGRSLSSLYGYTPQYASLEQIKGAGTDPQSDIYSVGATLHHLLTNTAPIDALERVSALVQGHPDPLRPASELNAQVSPAIDAVLMAALALDPAKRPLSAFAMRTALEAAQASSPSGIAQPALPIASVPTSVDTSVPRMLEAQRKQSLVPGDAAATDTTVVASRKRNSGRASLVIGAIVVALLVIVGIRAVSSLGSRSAVTPEPQVVADEPLRTMTVAPTSQPPTLAPTSQPPTLAPTSQPPTLAPTSQPTEPPTVTATPVLPTATTTPEQPTLTQPTQAASAAPAVAVCPPTVSFGVAIQCSIDAAGEIDSYTFEAKADDKVLLRIARASETLQPWIRLYAADKALICEGYSERIVDMLHCNLPRSGTYTLQVADASRNRTETGAYALYMQRLNQPDTIQPLAFGEMVTRAISTATQIDTFTFSGKVDDKILFRMTRESETIQPWIRMYAPDGNLTCEGYAERLIDALVCTLPRSGNFTLIISDSSRNRTETGTYMLYMQRLNSPGNAQAIAFGQTIEGSINKAAEIDSYSFEAKADDKAQIRMTRSTETLQPWIRVYAPNGDMVCEGYSERIADISNCSLPRSGTYTMLIADASRDRTETGSYTLYLVHP